MCVMRLFRLVSENVEYFPSGMCMQKHTIINVKFFKIKQNKNCLLTKLCIFNKVIEAVVSMYLYAN